MKKEKENSMKGDFKPVFDDAAVPTPGVKGDWGGTTGGAKIGSAPKTAKSQLPEVTTVSIKSAPKEGGKADSTYGVVAGRKKA